jgi:CSS domain containing protein
MHYRRPALTRLLTILFLLFAGLAASASLSPTAEAGLAGCRADPIVVLSDGTVLDVSVAIYTDVSNVTDIQYVVRGPSTARLVSVIGTPTLGFSGKEMFTYYPDAQPGQYITETVVQTTFDGVGVTAYTTFSKATLGYGPPLTLQYQPVYGFNAQVLRTVLRR